MFDLDSNDFFVPSLPKSIRAKETETMFSDVPESVKFYARALKNSGWSFYVVAQTRGYCDRQSKVITIPLWVLNQSVGEKIWYISHELAHAYTPAMFESHGKEFMAKLQEICPVEHVHFELGYKPRNAKAAGITKPPMLNL